MPKGYWIVRVDITDQEKYKSYIAANAEPLKKYGARFLVRGGPFENPEGTSRTRNAVIELAITPRLQSFADSDANWLRAPRSLNEPVYCRFSNFTNTSAPVTSESALEYVVGVRTTAPSMAAWARRTSSAAIGSATP